MSQQISQKGAVMTCPACGKTVLQRDIFFGQHSRVCPAVKAALEQAQPGAVQAKLKSTKKLEDLSMKTQTFSEKWSWVLETDFVRKHWGWMALATNLLSWLVGYQTPSFGFAWTLITIPGITFLLMGLYFNKKVVRGIRWILHLRHRTIPVATPTPEPPRIPANSCRKCMGQSFRKSVTGKLVCASCGEPR